MKLGKKLIALLMAVALCISMVPTAFAANSLGVTYTATLSVSELTVSDKAQTVTVTINADKEFEGCSIGGTAKMPEGIELTGITNTDQAFSASDYNLNNGEISYQTSDMEDATFTNVCVLTYMIPANTPAGMYILGIDELMITRDYIDTWEDGEDSVTATLTIKAPTVPVTGVTLNKGSMSLTAGESETLIATVYPLDATDKTVTWASSDTSVATVDGGVVTAVAAGTATITAKAGDFTATCTVTVGCAHTNKTEHPAKGATCTEDGNNEYWTCSTCGKVFKTDKTTETTVAAETIPAGHEYEFVPQALATCKDTGMNGHYTCKNCDAVFTTEKNPTTLDDLKLPVDGNNHVGTRALNYDANQHWWHCSGCDNDIGKANHSGGTATCTEQAKCTTCSQPYGDLKAHTLTKTEAKAATCTEAGNNEYWTCGTCNKVFSDAEGNTGIDSVPTIPALGHDMTKTEAVAPTCTEAGNNAYWTCGTCNKVFKDEAGNTVTTAEAEKIAALGHKMTKTNAKDATCTEAGNNAYWTCGTCNKVFKDEAGNTETSVEAEKIAALGHEYGTQIDKVPATCTKEGTEAHYKCSRCEKLFLDTTSGDAVTASDLVIDKIPHDYKGIYNETHHWTFCANCGATTDKAAHDFTVDEATGTKTCNCGYVVYGEGTALCDQHDTELVFDETHHWHVCKNCSYAEDKDAHDFGDWETDVEATTTTDGLKHRTCKECGYVQQEVIAKPSTTPSTRPTTRPSGGSNATSSDKVKSSKTFDAGIAAYVGLSVLSLTGSALVIGKKKEF